MSATTPTPDHLIERFADSSQNVAQMNPASEQCVNQTIAVISQMDTNEQTCNILNDDQQYEVDQQTIRQQHQEFKTRFDTLKRNYDTSSAFVDASNKAAALAENTNVSNAQVNLHQSHKLSQFNSDTMTAKRVATLSQQNIIHTNVVIGYMQTCSIFFCVAILVMFPFAFSVVRGFFRHPMVVMQILLIVVAVIGVVVALLHLWANRNHYWMLYQERVFDSPKMYVKETSKCDCGPDSSDDPPVDVTVAEDTCG